MWIGVGRITLDFYNNDSLKLKHKELEALCKELRREFNLSAMEVAQSDDPGVCIFGFAAIMPETWKETSAKAFLKKISARIDETAFARMTSEDTELFYHGPQ